MKPDQTFFTENKINLMVVIKISRTPSVVVEVEAQKMSLRSSVLYCISHSSFHFTYKNLHAARLASSESTNWNLKSTLRARYWYVNAQTRCWRVFTLVIERHKQYDLTSRYVVLSYSWNSFANSACSHWLSRGHMTSKSETVSRQNLLAGNIVKSMTTESNGHPGCQALFMRGFWCQAFTAVVSARDRRSISRQTPHAEKTSDSQGTKWPIPSKDKSTCKMSFERRGLNPWRLLNQGTGRWKWKMGPYSVASPTIHTLFLFSSDFQLSFPLACSSFPFPRSKETHLFGAKPLEEIVWFWNYPSALNKVGKPSFQNSKHHLRPKLSKFNLVLTQKWWQRP